ncbi:hypothetical protein [Flexivirga sp. B27]
MGKNTRGLHHSERFAFTGLAGSSEKKRDQVSANRAIEGLNQNDRIIGLLSQLVALQRDQNSMLGYLCAAEHDRSGRPLPTLGQ